jgi:hypothetical protein
MSDIIIGASACSTSLLYSTTSGTTTVTAYNTTWVFVDGTTTSTYPPFSEIRPVLRTQLSTRLTHGCSHHYGLHRLLACRQSDGGPGDGDGVQGDHAHAILPHCDRAARRGRRSKAVVCSDHCDAHAYGCAQGWLSWYERCRASGRSMWDKEKFDTSSLTTVDTPHSRILRYGRHDIYSKTPQPDLTQPSELHVVRCARSPREAYPFV